MTTPKSIEDESSQRRLVLVKEYRKLPFLPDVPNSLAPTKAERQHYQFMSMVQLCNIVEKFGKKRSFAHNAFGGNKGEKLVIPERQAWWVDGYPTNKYVLVSAADAFLSEVGIEW